MIGELVVAEALRIARLQIGSANASGIGFVNECFEQACKGLGATNILPPAEHAVTHFRTCGHRGARRITPSEAIRGMERLRPGMLYCMTLGKGQAQIGFIVRFAGREDGHGGLSPEKLVVVESDGAVVVERKRSTSAVNMAFIDWAAAFRPIVSASVKTEAIQIDEEVADGDLSFASCRSAIAV